MPVDSSVQTVLQKNTLVAITGWNHAAIHEVELDELCIGQVQVNRHQLTAATLCEDPRRRFHSLTCTISKTPHDHHSMHVIEDVLTDYLKRFLRDAHLDEPDSITYMSRISKISMHILIAHSKYPK